jgi:hypothetical protein
MAQTHLEVISRSAVPDHIYILLYGTRSFITWCTLSQINPIHTHTHTACLRFILIVSSPLFLVLPNGFFLSWCSTLHCVRICHHAEALSPQYNDKAYELCVLIMQFLLFVANSCVLEGPVKMAWNILTWQRSQHPDKEECCECVKGLTDNRQGAVGSPAEEGIDQVPNFPHKTLDLNGGSLKLPKQWKSDTKKITKPNLMFMW